MKLTVEVRISVGRNTTDARLRDEVHVGIGDVTQMLADDPLAFVQIIHRFSEGRVTPDSELDAGHFELLSAMKPGLSAAHAAASAKWKELLEGPK
jgi:hypothetical protein